MSNAMKDAMLKAAQQSGSIELSDMIERSDNTQTKTVEIEPASVSGDYLYFEDAKKRFNEGLISEDEFIARAEIGGVTITKEDIEKYTIKPAEKIDEKNEAEDEGEEPPFAFQEGEGLVIDSPSLIKAFGGEAVIIRHFDKETGEFTTTRINNPSEMIEILISTNSQIEKNLEQQEDAEYAKAKIPELMDNLSELLIANHGLQKVHEGDILHILAERQMMNSVLKELFNNLGFPLEEIRFAPTPFKTAFGSKMLSMQTIYNGARHIIVNYKKIIEENIAATTEAKRIKEAEKELLDAANVDRARAKVMRTEAEKFASENQRAIISFNTPATEKPFVLRGSYITVKKALKGEKVIEKKRIVYVGVKKNAKYDEKSGLPYTKYLFATPKMELAARFQSVRDAKDCLARLDKKFKANALKEEAGFNMRKMASLRVTRIIMESLA